jgi:hypothetical protein
MKRRSLFTMVGLAVLSFATVAHAIDRDFTVHNNIGNAIMEMHITPSSTTTWGADILGVDTLADDASVLIHYTPSMYRGQCVFDIKIVDSAGPHVVSGINLCRVTDVTFTRDGDGDVAYSAH